VKVDTGLPMSTNPRTIIEAAKDAEAFGWSGIFSVATAHDRR
jgi:hypothetical protein